MWNIDWETIKNIIEIIVIVLGISGVGTIFFIKIRNSNKNKVKSNKSQVITGDGNNQAGGDITNVTTSNK